MAAVDDMVGRRSYRTKPRTVPVMAYWPYATKRLHDEARRLAIRAVGNALKLGKLQRQPCEKCAAGDAGKRGKRAKAQAHHDDYSKPLEVRWLCLRHHREWHREHVATTPSSEQIQDVRRSEYAQVLMTCPETIALVRSATTKILDAMDTAGITQSDLANRLGVSRQHANGFFHGGIRTLKALATIAAAIGLDVHIELAQGER